MKNDLLIGVTGYLASGKDTVAEYIVNQDFHHYSLSDELRLILKEKGISINRDNLRDIANDYRKRCGNGFLATRLIKKIKKPAVVTSIRSVDEIVILKKEGNFYLIFVDAPIKIRYERLKKRARENDENLSYDKFITQENLEKSKKSNEQQLDRVAEMADFVIDNNGTLDSLNKNIDTVLRKINATKK